jgi:hypothetical protein
MKWNFAAVVSCILFSGISFGQVYTHEIQSNLNYDASSGTVTSGEDTTDITKNTVSGRISYGYFASKNVEPFIEVLYRSVEEDVGGIATTESKIDYGLGMLFNLPDDPKPKNKKGKSEAVSNWEPYVGVLMYSMSSDSDAANSTTISQKSIVTKLVFGTRYMLYKHIGLNSSIRLYYQDSTSDATSSGDASGAKSETTYEIQLVGLTLLI